MSADNPFVYRLRVRFAECDPQKVAFNGVYGLYIDLAVFEFMRAMGFGESLVKGPLDYQVVKQSVEWTGPARFDQVVEISIWAKHLGNTSFTIATEFRIAGDPKVSATGETRPSSPRRSHPWARFARRTPAAIHDALVLWRRPLPGHPPRPAARRRRSGIPHPRRAISQQNHRRRGSVTARLVAAVSTVPHSSLHTS